MSKEIERKFIVSRLPAGLDECPSHNILQGYITEGGSSPEVRLRQKDERYYLTVKGGAGLVRSEYEVPITASQFSELWPITLGRRLEKRRYDLPGGIELDVYDGKLRGLLIAEAEFESEEAANSFTSPTWFGKEVTEDDSYKNQTLASKGVTV